MPVSTCGTITAAPAPCSSRPRISTGVVGANPHSSDAPVNAATPTVNTRSGPNRAPIRAPAMSSVA